MTPRGRRALRDLLRGRPVDFAGWPVAEVVAVLDAALVELTALRDRGRRELASMQAQVDQVKAMLERMDASIDLLLEVRAKVVSPA